MKGILYTEELPSEKSRRKKRGRRRLLAFFGCLVAAGLYCLIAFRPNASAVSVPQAAGPAAGTVSSAASSETVSKPQTEKQVSLQNAAKPLWVQVSLAKQTVTVYDARNMVVQHYICSTGEEGDDTPTGTFTVSDRGKSFFSEKYQEGAYYWTRFQGSFLFHSVPFDKKQEYKPEEAAKLGTKASHGCVRLATENAKWIYENIPRGAKVAIE